MGFAVPLDMWFRGSLEERMTSSLDGPVLTRSGLFDPAYLRQIGTEHRTGRRNHSAVLWALLMFEGFLGTLGKRATNHDPFVEGVRASMA